MRRCIYTLLCFLFLTAFSFGQDTVAPVLLDEFSEVCSEDLMARMDNLFIQLANNPSARAVVILHGRQDMEGRSQELSRYISTVYPNRRRYDASRLNVLRGASQEKQLVQFWVVPPGTEDPRPEKAFVPNDYAQSTLFDRARTDFHRWDGTLDIYNDGFLDLGCDFSPNRGLFAKILKENKTLSAFLIVYTAEKRNAGRGVRIASFALNDLVKNFGVPRSRVRAIYGGARKEPEIEFWLVPRGQRPPPARRNLPPVRSF